MTAANYGRLPARPNRTGNDHALRMLREARDCAEAIIGYRRTGIAGARTPALCAALAAKGIAAAIAYHHARSRT